MVGFLWPIMIWSCMASFVWPRVGLCVVKPYFQLLSQALSFEWIELTWHGVAPSHCWLIANDGIWILPSD